MSDEKMQSRSGRWDHLLREIPSKKITESKPARKAPEPAPTPAVQENSEDEIFKVSQINRAIKNQLEGKFSHIWLQGEISNFKAHTSGHHYFSLKDEKAQINAVMFKGYNSRLKFRPESGMEVLVRGKITVYEPRGNYQIFCEHMEPVGAGALQKAFEQLKAKLQKEGLFDEDKKQALPPFPKKVGVVTSPTGAAIQDILNVLGRRSKRVNVTVIPARVQGEGAAQEIVKGIELANQLKLFDVLIVGRGGGSIEDLWCFNEEMVARAIYKSKIPIISAVGHEIDFTIADFVGDLRAPTPSAAAEIVAASESELNEKLKFYSKSLRLLQFQKIEELKNRIEHLGQRMISPKKRVEDSLMRLEDYRQRLEGVQKRYFEKLKISIQSYTRGLKSPREVLNLKSQKVANLKKLLELRQKTQLEKSRSQLGYAAGLLDSLSPLKTLDRGYAVVKQEGKLVPSVQFLKSKDIQVQFRDGTVDAEVKKVNKKEKA